MIADDLDESLSSPGREPENNNVSSGQFLTIDYVQKRTEDRLQENDEDS